MYTCSRCKREITELETKFTRCPHCGHRVLYKARQPISRDISTD